MFVCICILANILSSSNVLSSLVCNGVNAEVIDIKGRWPEVVGLTVEDAKNIIRKEKPRGSLRGGSTQLPCYLRL